MDVRLLRSLPGGSTASADADRRDDSDSTYDTGFGALEAVGG